MAWSEVIASVWHPDAVTITAPGGRKGLHMNCQLCGRELKSESEYCGFCEQVVTRVEKSVESHDRPVLRVTIGPEGATEPYLNEDGTPKPTKSAECPDCGHTIFTVIGPKFDEPHEHNMLIVECGGCGFKGRMRWQGVARTRLTIRAPDQSDSDTTRS